MTVGVPAAVVGAIALALSSSPAHADDRVNTQRLSEDRALRAMPVTAIPAVTTTAAAQVAASAPQTTALGVVSTASTPKTYTVKRGDTVSAIAGRHGLRTADVLALNNLSWKSVIYPGQVLTLTSGGSSSTPAKTTTSTPKTSATSYTIKRGDTISAIAARHKVSTSAVLSANGLKSSSIIYPGQKITIPGAKSTTSSSSSTSASKTTTKPSTSSSSSSGGTYTIKRGDTISAIASRHKVSTSAVLSANGLKASTTIYPGQKITIPGAKASSSSSASTSTSKPSTSKPSTSTSGSYTIKAGDTISAIASRHGVSTSALLSANGLKSSSIIYPGQKITIPGTGVTASVPASNTSSSPTITLDAEQRENARLIIQVGRELGVPERGIAIALGTAMQESWIRNLDWGDRDSLGLFQQRPSTGWGTADQVRDRVRSIKTFYGGPSDPNGYATRGLLDIPGWEKMSYTQAAQAVQISAYPDRYAQWEKASYEWLAALG
ncbi:LysM peptidoglycan-binding domain-containing protein [Microbacterium sp. C7(2022)]|uniref:LysM peptidoglycan-binding domain-containing protein n=1 Tax=Microbacterium sp. C7(2022) TaxID=2992759 RepID=UPI00237B256E|nr:LysM peptidoglycan-binding domain-containing protein [Microbacterium sp. C7(2022)]MDE0546740.1 LysM peptidoglycan-binding domain-containing protein [Microbacterium sp. C7(2022)]